MIKKMPNQSIVTKIKNKKTKTQNKQQKMIKVPIQKKFPKELKIQKIPKIQEKILNKKIKILKI